MTINKLGINRLWNSGAGGTPPEAGAGTLDFIGYGQSNWLFHTSTTYVGQPTAHPDTLFWNSATNQWTTPVGAGIVALLNTMQAATGKVCRLVSGGASGVPIAWLQKGFGTNIYEDLLARVSASGINPAYILFHQGEGDTTAVGANLANYQAAVNTLHSSIVVDTGKTIDSLPFINSSLGQQGNAQPAAEQTYWAIIQEAIATINDTYANIHYSHSNADATLIDAVHWDGQSYERSGKRYAQTALFLSGLASTRPRWSISSAERVSATETRTTVTYLMGTDFTPTSGITGLEISTDNGATYIQATGARESATSILWTHSDIGTTARLVRYQWGPNANLTAPALDNSGLSNNLDYTTQDIVIPGAVALPAFTYSGTQNLAQTGTPIQNAPNPYIVPGGSDELLVVLGMTHRSSTPLEIRVTANPSSTVLTATAVVTLDTNSPDCGVYQVITPIGTTSVDVEIEFPGNSFQGSVIHVSTIPTANLNSTTAEDSSVSKGSATTTQSVDLSTTAGAAIFAHAANDSTAGGVDAAITGDESYASRSQALANGLRYVMADASGASLNANNTVTATFPNSANTAIAAASWR